jgi:hypothetical protein
MLAVGWWGGVAGFWAVVCKLFGLFPLLTGLLGWDPAYQLLHLSTGDPPDDERRREG